jgi:hypothetical protein
MRSFVDFLNFLFVGCFIIIIIFDIKQVPASTTTSRRGFKKRGVGGFVPNLLQAR